MAKFHKVPAIFKNTEDSEKSELLGIDLPTETEITNIYIDFERIESFAESEEDTSYTEIVMHSGLHAILALDVATILNMINGKV